MNTRLLRSAGSFALLSLLLIGCGVGTSKPASDRRWAAIPVVASLYEGPGYAPYNFAWSQMPRLVVYADGQVIVSSLDYANAEFTRSVEVARVAPDEVCSLLNQIDGYGFFDYDSAEYAVPRITDNGTTEIIVNAWRSMEARPYALDHALENPERGMFTLSTVPPALAKTYRLLGGYRPPNLAPYRPERIAVLIERDALGRDPADWPLAAPTIKDLAATIKDGRGQVLLEGQQAVEVSALFGQLVTRTYRDGGASYAISVRPLLPLEIWAPHEGWGRNSQFEQEPAVEMACVQ